LGVALVLHRRVGPVAVVVLAFFAAAAAPSSASVRSSAAPRTRGYYVYWDQNEEQDSVREPGGQHGQLIPPWDPNGQMCVVPDHSGRFAVGYNPTLASQHNPGSKKPVKAPPVGEALYDRNGKFTGKTLYVPGRYKLPGQKVGGDIPPDAGKQPPVFNSNGTYTGCVFDKSGNLFATDLGTAQGEFPSPDNGRLIEWFAPAYSRACIVAGPTTGGDGPHHVDGQGGLSQPGDMALDTNGDILMPEAGVANGGVPAGRVDRIDHTSLPRGAADCPGGIYAAGKLRTSVFFQGSLTLLPFPLGIARDPSCNCWAIGSTIGDPAVAWFDDQGAQRTDRGVINGESIADIGMDPNGWNPFGLAFAPDGTLYFVDIHLHCGPGLTDCGPATKAGRVLKVTFANGQPQAPTPIATGIDFPTSVTVCVPGEQTCPIPRATRR
jgi:hypothetical protein